MALRGSDRLWLIKDLKEVLEFENIFFNFAFLI